MKRLYTVIFMLLLVGSLFAAGFAGKTKKMVGCTSCYGELNITRYSLLFGRRPQVSTAGGAYHEEGEVTVIILDDEGKNESTLLGDYTYDEVDGIGYFSFLASDDAVSTYVACYYDPVTELFITDIEEIYDNPETELLRQMMSEKLFQ